MLQARITPWVATVVVLPLIVLGAGSQNLLWAFQIGFLGSVALGLGAMLLVNHAGAWQRRDWAALAPAVFALLWSGVSVLLVVVCVLVVLLRRGIKPAAAFAIPPAVVYIVWAARLSTADEPRRADRARVLRRPVAVRRHGLSTAADAFVLDAPLARCRSVLLLLVVYLVRTAERATTEAAVAYACAVGAVAQFVLSAYGRQKLGHRPGDARSRYGYVAIILLAPAVAMALDRILRRATRAVPRRVRRRLPDAGRSRTLQLLRDDAFTEADARATGPRAAILAAAQIANDPTQRLAPEATPEPHYSPDLTARRPAPVRRERRAARLAALARRSS